MPNEAEERRRYLRLTTPIDISYIINGTDKISRSVSKDISAVGVRLEFKDNIQEGTALEIIIDLPGAPNPVHAKGKIVWIKRISLEDNAPYDAGVEFIKIEEDNKNTFLKYLCNLIYNQTQNIKNKR